MTDPEDTVDLMPADLEETEVDVADEFERPIPLEAEPADVIEQKLAVDEDDDYPDLDVGV
ncbi:MAG: hypothetical protein JWO57_3756 [Pseudonocardiales bacterium]|nr:hypothetical protein [Pseudonocardiales bacterium]